MGLTALLLYHNGSLTSLASLTSLTSLCLVLVYDGGRFYGIDSTVAVPPTSYLLLLLSPWDFPRLRGVVGNC